MAKHRNVIAAGLAAVTLLGAVLGASFWPKRTEPILTRLTPAPTSTPVPTATPSPLRVYVTGAVLHPDVYSLPAGSIVKDALLAAGGATGEADLERINLAAPLSDGLQIYVPRLSEPTPPVPILSTPSSSRVNINTADVPALESLPGIGPAIAQRILDYRRAHGPFAEPRDLLKVPGIGPAVFEEMEDLITTE